jgi:CRP-like cAMP-binding protein
MTESGKEIEKYIFTYDSIWNSISPSTSNKLRDRLTVTTFKKNEILYREGIFPRGLYILKSGIAKLQFVNSDGQEQIIHMIKEYEMFGYRSLISKAPSFAYITAVTDCEVELVDKDIFLQTLQSSKDLNAYIMNLFSKELSVFYYKMTYFTLRPVNERIALTLLILAYKFQSTSKSEKSIVFSKSDIASFAGTIIETLSRQLRILIENNIITTDGRKIIITDLKKLIQLANLES